MHVAFAFLVSLLEVRRFSLPLSACVVPCQLRKRAKQQTILDANSADALKMKVKLTQAEAHADDVWRDRLLELCENGFWEESFKCSCVIGCDGVNFCST